MKLLVFGAGGHAKVIADIIARQGKHTIAAFVDENKKGQTFLGVPCYSEQDLATHTFTHAVVALGDNFTRSEVVGRLLVRFPKLEFISAVHPAAVIGADVTLGPGTVVMAGAIINPGCRIGSHVIVNTRSSIDHDCTLEDFASVAPGVTLGGNTKIGSGSAISIGAVVLHGRTIGARTVVGAGAVVVSDVEPDCVAFGNPCKKRRARKPSDRYL